ncbi:type II secretion system F family protein [Galactobacter sp.]|uniref:type II secretion system F family protein n=1 Tax=Galactobacter sp. TaxID=2676125 RepID=UPI0025B9BC5B|nr:type II secretion system F family protein [Galactobacter sp.]
MSIILGCLLGCGLALVWYSGFGEPSRRRRSGIRNRLDRAGYARTRVATFLLISVAVALGVGLMVLALTSTVSVSALAGLAAGLIPTWALGPAAQRRTRARRSRWPDAVDHLRSGVRAGVPLSEALAELGRTGPEQLRAPFRAYAADLRVGRNVDEALARLKQQIADPVGDRLVAAVRLTREVGGADVGATLATLSSFLRADIATRGELEARQSWTVNAARLAVVAPWLLLIILCLEPRVAEVYDSVAGAVVLLLGVGIAALSYVLMIRASKLPDAGRPNP